ncbi:MAG TPA: hypothetical protein VLO30_01615 [Chthoniobacterales bacterium]|nr:hypothetical protein [Chthoniobacterales bacterium]
MEVLSRSEILEGKPFGDTGASEKIIGKIHFAAISFLGSFFPLPKTK